MGKSTLAAINGAMIFFQFSCPALTIFRLYMACWIRTDCSL